MLQYSLVLTVSGKYGPFIDIVAAILTVLARNRGVVISSENAREALQPMLTLALYHDVFGGLSRLKHAGFRILALTNSSSTACKVWMDNAQLTNLFECQLSVDTLTKYKPHADIYRWASSEMNVSEADCMLVAAHA